MLDPENEVVIDAVAHAYNLSPSNYADPASSHQITELTYQIGGKGSPQRGCDVPHDVYLDDWQPEHIANVLFKETATGRAVAHSLPLYCFKDVCEMIGYVRSEALARVVALPGVREVRVTPDSGLDWDHDMIAPQAQARRKRRLTALRASQETHAILAAETR
ncbi:MAG: hypothetical protein V4579_05380 [Pseudomonadota bacterium]